MQLHSTMIFVASSICSLLLKTDPTQPYFKPTGHHVTRFDGAKSQNDGSKYPSPPATLSPTPNEPRPGAEREFVGIDFVWVPAGTYIMGSPPDEQFRSKVEVRHRVTFSHGFWIGKYEITQQQWQSVMGENPSEFKGQSLPVERVSYIDVDRFIDNLNEKQEGIFRLPTEAEWEYACRAGTTTPFSIEIVRAKDISIFPDPRIPLPEMLVNFGGIKGSTEVVGTSPSNAWGIHDMHGNVAEMCADYFGGYPTGSVTDPTGPIEGPFLQGQVLRGGGWSNPLQECRSAARLRLQRTDRANNIGFRVCRQDD